VPQPVQGYVMATMTDPGTGNEDATYVFEAPNPMEPECEEGEPPQAAPSGILKRGI